VPYAKNDHPKLPFELANSDRIIIGKFKGDR
jgi:hypothetical protein